MLSVCALRIDGYAWAIEQGVEREQLMKPFWHPELRDWLLEQSWDYQWAAWFMQQRAHRWTDTPPQGDVLALWRRLFLALANKRPSPPFDSGGPDGDGGAVWDWERRFAPRLPELLRKVGERLQRDAPLDEPLLVSALPRGKSRRARD
jgi:hypothetical protein